MELEQDPIRDALAQKWQEGYLAGLNARDTGLCLGTYPFWTAYILSSLLKAKRYKQGRTVTYRLFGRSPVLKGARRHTLANTPLWNAAKIAIFVYRKTVPLSRSTGR